MRFLYYLLFPYLADKDRMKEYWEGHSFALAVAGATWVTAIPAVIVYFLGNIWWQMLLFVVYIGGVVHIYLELRKEDKELARQTEDVDESGPDCGRPGESGPMPSS